MGDIADERVVGVDVSLSSDDVISYYQYASSICFPLIFNIYFPFGLLRVIRWTTSISNISRTGFRQDLVHGQISILQREPAGVWFQYIMQQTLEVNGKRPSSSLFSIQLNKSKSTLGSFVP